jgi:hypothetical protein
LSSSINGIIGGAVSSEIDFSPIYPEASESELSSRDTLPVAVVEDSLIVTPSVEAVTFVPVRVKPYFFEVLVCCAYPYNYE